MRRSLIFSLAILLMLTICAAAQTSFVDRGQILDILKKRIVEQQRGDTIIVGVVDPTGSLVVSFSRAGEGTADGDTLFEIGSISKVFTAELLAEMVSRGELSLDDPLQKYLPARVKIPTRNGKQITLLNLTVQNSGLPRMPNNFNPKDPGNPYADYTVDDMYAFLNGYTLTRDIGEKFEYSNLGVGLLGHTLAVRSGMSYEALLRERILAPLGMKSTAIELTPELKARFIDGYDEGLMPAPHWDIPTLAGAGGIRSSVNDLLLFLKENLGITDHGLHAIMAGAQKPRASMGRAGLEIGMNWVVQTGNGSTITWHNGGTGGFRTFLGMDTAGKRGVVVLTNTANGSDDIGMHLLNPAYAVAELPKPHKRITVDTKIYDDYLGTYQLTPVFAIEVSRDGDSLFIQATGQQKVEIYPEAKDAFFLTIVDAQITFARDAGGKVIGLALNQNGALMPGKKVK